MGRWAQRRLRGGGGGPPVDSTPRIIAVTAISAFVYRLTFNAPVTTLALDPSDGSFAVSGVTPDGGTTVAPGTGLTVDLTFGDGTGAGNLWELNYQPFFISTPIVNPDSGLTD